VDTDSVLASCWHWRVGSGRLLPRRCVPCWTPQGSFIHSVRRSHRNIGFRYFVYPACIASLARRHLLIDLSRHPYRYLPIYMYTNIRRPCDCNPITPYSAATLYRETTSWLSGAADPETRGSARSSGRRSIGYSDSNGADRCVSLSAFGRRRVRPLLYFRFDLDRDTPWQVLGNISGDCIIGGQWWNMYTWRATDTLERSHESQSSSKQKISVGGNITGTGWSWHIIINNLFVPQYKTKQKS